MKTNFEIKELKGKKRKGQYIYYTNKQGKKKYTKYRTEIPLETYEKAINKNQIKELNKYKKTITQLATKQKNEKKETKKIENTRKKAQQELKGLLKRIKAYKTTYSYWKKGIQTTHQENDIYNLTKSENEKKAYENLLNNLVIQKKTKYMDILWKAKKTFKEKMYYYITIYGTTKESQKEQVLARIEDKDKTIDEIAQTYEKYYTKTRFIYKTSPTNYTQDLIQQGKIKPVKGKAEQYHAGNVTKVSVIIKITHGKT